MTVTDIEIAELGTEPLTQAERDAISAYCQRITGVPDCFDLVPEDGLGVLADEFTHAETPDLIRSWFRMLGDWRDAITVLAEDLAEAAGNAVPSIAFRWSCPRRLPATSDTNCSSGTRRSKAGGGERSSSSSAKTSTATASTTSHPGPKDGGSPTARTGSTAKEDQMAAGDTQITIAGNLVDDPELRFTPSGQSVARFRVASTPRPRQRPGRGVPDH
jgi:hypothetical protein